MFKAGKSPRKPLDGPTGGVMSLWRAILSYRGTSFAASFTVFGKSWILSVQPTQISGTPGKGLQARPLESCQVRDQRDRSLSPGRAESLQNRPAQPFWALHQVDDDAA